MAIKVHGVKVKPREIDWGVLPGVDGFGDRHIGVLFGQIAFEISGGGGGNWYLHPLLPILGQSYDESHPDLASAKNEAAEFLAGHLWFILDCDEDDSDAEPSRDDEEARVYADVCDLFDQALIVGANGAYDKEPQTGADRLRCTSPTARRFAMALEETVIDPLLAKHGGLTYEEIADGDAIPADQWVPAERAVVGIPTETDRVLIEEVTRRLAAGDLHANVDPILLTRDADGKLVYPEDLPLDFQDERYHCGNVLFKRHKIAGERCLRCGYVRDYEEYQPTREGE